MKLGLLLFTVFTLALSPRAMADTGRAPEREIQVWPDAAPGTESWTGDEIHGNTTAPGIGPVEFYLNVRRPTLTVVRPTGDRSNGTSMIVLPGGGFQALAWNLEGTEVANWLAHRGITAFVLKYRIRMDPSIKIGQDARRNPASFDVPFAQLRPLAQFAIADAAQALKLIRRDSARFGIDPNRIGMIGFSAGAITTMGVALNPDPASRPNFAVPIYGAMYPAPIPSDAPPLFIVAAEDDATIPVAKSIEMFEQWNLVERPAELHIYPDGGHGFGIRKNGKSSDAWPVAFETWLRARKLLDQPQ